MNSQFHDEFVALCPLYFSGDISEEEWALLQIHMAYCDSCHEKFLQYQQITSDVIPAMAAVAAAELDYGAEESPAAVHAAERRLMSQLGSVAPEKERRPRRRFDWLPPRTLFAVCALAIAGLATVLFFNLRPHSATQEARSIPANQLPLQPVSTNPDPKAQQALRDAQREITNLQQQLNASENRFKQANEVAESAQKQLAAERTARSQIDSERESLSRQLSAAQAEANSLRSKPASAGSDGTELALRINTLESTVRELRTALDEKDTALSDKDRMLALDKDFLAHDRDIRDLIGARNLYIADIFDTTENGRTAKQFGRIFYTKDRSLVFYGFDLDSQASHKQNVSFQVWGSGSERPTPVSLGLFYQDDTHKRWVLRCNDAKSLARLDMVFVTVEPPGGSNRPTGKPLLRAYLQIQPNHP